MEIACAAAAGGREMWDALGALGDVLCSTDFDGVVFADVACSAAAGGIVRGVRWLHTGVSYCSGRVERERGREVPRGWEGSSLVRRHI